MDWEATETELNSKDWRCRQMAFQSLQCRLQNQDTYEIGRNLIKLSYIMEKRLNEQHSKVPSLQFTKYHMFGKTLFWAFKSISQVVLLKTLFLQINPICRWPSVALFLMFTQVLQSCLDCLSVLLSFLGEVDVRAFSGRLLGGVVQRLADPHAAVRNAAKNAFQQFAEKLEYTYDDAIPLFPLPFP